MTARIDSSPLLIDIGRVPADASNIALESLHKAMADPPSGDIWSPHHDPVLRDLIEAFTTFGLQRLERMRVALLEFIKGKPGGVLAKSRAQGSGEPPKPDMWRRWTEAELEEVKDYLEALPADGWGFEDHLLLVEWIQQRYWPRDEIRAEADWLAYKANMAGRVQRALAKRENQPSDAVRGIWIALPTNQEETDRFAGGLSSVSEKCLQFSREKTAANIVALSDKARASMAAVIIDHQQAVFTGDRAGTAEALESKLLDTFGALNRDWRRIALTETQEAANNGMIATLPPGTIVERQEVYATACAYCKKIHGTRLEVAEPGKARYLDGQKYVWPGKSNTGRSASPMKRVGRELVERLDAERWWVPAGPVHPNCRGQWAVVAYGKTKKDAKPVSGSDEAFTAWRNNVEDPDALDELARVDAALDKLLGVDRFGNKI